MTPRKRVKDSDQIRITQRSLDYAVGSGPLGAGEVGLLNGFLAEVDDPEVDYLVSMVVVAHEGRLACGELTLRQRDGGAPVTGQGLRTVTIETYMTKIRESQSPFIVEQVKDFPAGSIAFEPASAEALEQFEASQRVRRSSLENLTLVANEYRRALNSPNANAPTEAVAAKLHYSRGHVSRLLSQAREAGLLGPAKPGQPGEVHPPSKAKKTRGDKK